MIWHVFVFMHLQRAWRVLGLIPWPALTRFREALQICAELKTERASAADGPFVGCKALSQ